MVSYQTLPGSAGKGYISAISLPTCLIYNKWTTTWNTRWHVLGWECIQGWLFILHTIDRLCVKLSSSSKSLEMVSSSVPNTNSHQCGTFFHDGNLGQICCFFHSATNIWAAFALTSFRTLPVALFTSTSPGWAACSTLTAPKKQAHSLMDCLKVTSVSVLCL